MFIKPDTKNIFLAQVCLVTLICACYFSAPVFFIVKYIVTIFSVGRSDFKVYFFLFYCLALLSFRYFKPAVLWRRLPIFNIALALVLYLFGFILFLDFNRQFFNDPFGAIYAIRNANLSSTTIYHTHNAKVVLAMLQQLITGITNEPVGNYDSGYPFLWLYPSYTIILHAALYVLFFCTTLYQLLSYDRLSASFYTLFSLVSFVIIRNVLDGGVFFVESAVTLPIYLILQFELWKKGVIKSASTSLIKSFSVVTIFVALPYLCAMIFLEWLRVDSPFHYIFLLLFLVLVYIFFNSAISCRKRIFLTSQYFLLLGLANYSQIYQGWGDRHLSYIFREILGNFTVSVPTANIKKYNLVSNNSLDILRLQEIGKMTLIFGHAKSSIRTWQLSEYFQIPIRLGDVDVDGITCASSDGYEITGQVFVIQKEEPIDKVEKSFGKNKLTLTPVDQAKINRPELYDLRIYAEGCSGNRDNLVKHMLDSIGISLCVVKVNVI